MARPRSVFRLFQLVFMLIFVTYSNAATTDHFDTVPIGVVFDKNTDEVQNAFKFAMVQFANPNTTRLDLQLYVDVINTADAFKLSRLICNQLNRNVVSMLAAVTADSFETLHSFTNTFNLPFITPWFPEKVIRPSSGFLDNAVSLRPDYHRAVIDTITYYGWKNVIFIYDSHDGLLRLQQLYQSLQPGNAMFRISNVKRVSNATDVVQFLNSLERLDRWSNKYVVLDSSTRLAKDALILHVRDVKLGRRNYHYFLSGLVLDDRWERTINEFGAINVTGFKLIDFSRKVVRDFIELWRKDTISAKAALMYDGVQVLVDSIFRMLTRKPEIARGLSVEGNNTKKRMDCDPRPNDKSFEVGEKISRLIKKTEIEGLSGYIKFNEQGHRRNFTLQVVEMTVKGDFVKIGTWYDYKGLIPKVGKQKTKQLGQYSRNRTYIVTTIEEAPYVMRSDLEPSVTYPFKGFCVELAQLILDLMEIKYELRLVKDNKYGKDNPKVVGGWDGMIGEILRKETDLVIAPLTITLERESVVDFSKPFLAFDVKPDKVEVPNLNTIFSFLQPLSTEIWICLIFSFFGVSLVLFLVSRFSPSEWRVISFTQATRSPEPDDADSNKMTVLNEFSFWNSLWYSLGSFMQQGSDISPRSLPGRIVGTVWCFFALVVVCSYTANLASYLTLSRISEPAQLYSKVTACPEDVLAGHNYGEDENNGHSPSSHPGWLSFLLNRAAMTLALKLKEKPCELLVTVTRSGVREFAVAFPKGSKLREGVNLALQTLKNEGELQRLLRKWFLQTECDNNDQTMIGAELTLSQLGGLFYILLAGLALALLVALFEFFCYGRSEAARVKIPLRDAFKAKARLPPSPEVKTTRRVQRREQERSGWNTGPYSGYYTSANQDQEETALQASFTQV